MIVIIDREYSSITEQKGSSVSLYGGSVYVCTSVSSTGSSVSMQSYDNVKGCRRNAGTQNIPVFQTVWVGPTPEAERAGVCTVYTCTSALPTGSPPTFHRRWSATHCWTGGCSADDISCAVDHRAAGILTCDLHFSWFSDGMIRFLGSWLWYKLSLNLMGAWYLIREQVDFGLLDCPNFYDWWSLSGVGPAPPPPTSRWARREACCGDWRGAGYRGEGCQETGK